MHKIIHRNWCMNKGKNKKNNFYEPLSTLSEDAFMYVYHIKNFTITKPRIPSKNASKYQK